MGGQIPKKDKERRWHRVMALQKEIAVETGRSWIGRTLKVLVEEPGVARGEADAPDIDGRIFVQSDLPAGQFAEVTITGCRDYDLWARPRPEGTRRRRASQGKPGR